MTAEEIYAAHLGRYLLKPSDVTNATCGAVQASILNAMKEVAELAFDAGTEFEFFGPSLKPTKEQFINDLFNTSK